jgi:hypothetical protein
MASDIKDGGTSSESEVDPELKLLSLRVEFWSKRLDHTLSYTQTATRLIYLVDGAVLALLFFLIQTLGTTRSVIFIIAFPTILLSLLNLLHSRFMSLQHSWYTGIEAQMRQLLGQEQIVHRPARRYFASTHGVYRAIHILIWLFLTAAAVVMLLYGLGYFELLEIRKPGALNAEGPL